MVLVTQDAQVYRSVDAGESWSKVASPPIASIGFNEKIAYNPNVPGEVWIVSTVPDGVFKSTDAALDGWQNVTPSYSLGADISFTSTGSVYLPHSVSTDEGNGWQSFGPLTSNGAPIFPGDSQVGFVADGTYGVQKTTDGGQTWQGADQGLTGMTCSSLDVSSSDPLQVFATFGNWPGVYRSNDGAGTWAYSQASSDYASMDVVRTDPIDPGNVYAVSHTNVYRSTNGGGTWADLGWNAPKSPPDGAVLWAMAVDPFRAGHLLVALDTGAYLTGPGYLYASSDYGASWQAVTLPQSVARITDIAFDPETSGLVYVATGGAGNTTPGTGVYRSTDGGASWMRIDDRKQPGMADAQTFAIATHPQHMLFVAASNNDYRSLDNGKTWQKTQSSPGSRYLFAGADSTRLYAGDSTGLYSSSDGGDTWTRAAGGFGHLPILALGCGNDGGQTILYAATTGGAEGATTGSTAAAPRTSLAAGALVHAGIYRYALLPAPRLTLKLSGLKGGVLRLGRSLTASGKVTPSRFARSKVKLTVQRKGRKWVTLKTVTRVSSAKGAYSWKYKPAKRGSYRLRATVAKTTKTAAATTKWRTLKVK